MIPHSFIKIFKIIDTVSFTFTQNIRNDLLRLTVKKGAQFFKDKS